MCKWLKVPDKRIVSAWGVASIMTTAPNIQPIAQNDEAGGRRHRESDSPVGDTAAEVGAEQLYQEGQLEASDKRADESKLTEESRHDSRFMGPLCHSSQPGRVSNIKFANHVPVVYSAYAAGFHSIKTCVWVRPVSRKPSRLYKFCARFTTCVCSRTETSSVAAWFWISLTKCVPMPRP
jgi:hypothetical protein